MSNPRFVETEVAVTVPATSANLGPGFDALGLALTRYDQVRATVTPSGLEISVTGEGEAVIPRDERHLIVRSMRAAFERLGGQPPGLRLNCENRIPHGRGLGSSAAAIVAGVELARGLVVGGREILNDQDALALASRIEGHPDNVAACLLGGLAIAWTADGVASAVRVDLMSASAAKTGDSSASAAKTGDLSASGVCPVLLIPREESATEAARSALPSVVPHADAAFNASRSALLVVAMQSRPDMLMRATEDRLHQTYRAAAMTPSYSLVTTLRAAGFAAVISGAGSTVLVLATSAAQASMVERYCPAGWEYAPLNIAEGALLS